MELVELDCYDAFTSWCFFACLVIITQWLLHWFSQRD